MDIEFSRNLIKGKIAELIFQEMFRVADEFMILPLGYEHTTPILAQYQHFVHIKKVLDNIRHAPDFALISQDKTKVFLVEVKYRESFTQETIREIATELFVNWSPCFLFLVSRDIFYFESAQEIASQNGKVNRLPESWIKKEIQNSYLSLLREFIK